MPTSRSITIPKRQVVSSDFNISSPSDCIRSPISQAVWKMKSRSGGKSLHEITLKNKLYARHRMEENVEFMSSNNHEGAESKIAGIPYRAQTDSMCDGEGEEGEGMRREGEREVEDGEGEGDDGDGMIGESEWETHEQGMMEDVEGEEHQMEM